MQSSWTHLPQSVQLIHFSPGLLLSNGSSQTKHWHVSRSVSFCRLAGFNSFFGTSVLAILRPVVLLTFAASASRALFTGVSVRILERGSLFATLICFARAFVNGCTSPGERCSSRHDDLPRVGASLGRLPHASTSPVKTRQPAPSRTAAICKPQHIAQLP